MIDIKGSVFGRLTAVKHTRNDTRGEAMWECLCVCKSVVEVRSSALRKGRTRSCGCFQKDKAKELKTTHGGTGSRLYSVWGKMLSRCRCNSDFLKSGQRNCWKDVTVCGDWVTFSEFRKWAEGSGYKDSLSIDRIEGANVYSPGTCRWADRSLQSANRARSADKKGSTFLGVHPYNNKSGRFYWLIMVGGKSEYKGPFDTQEDAAISRNQYITENNLPHRINEVKRK